MNLRTQFSEYGAFSHVRGRVTVTSEFINKGELLVNEWRETGGPTVKPPKRARDSVRNSLSK